MAATFAVCHPTRSSPPGSAGPSKTSGFPGPDCLAEPVGRTTGASRNDRPGFISRWLSGQREFAKPQQQLSFAGLVNKRDVLAGICRSVSNGGWNSPGRWPPVPNYCCWMNRRGMNQEEIQQLDDRLQAIRKRGITILLVEHVMELVMGVTDRIAVLNFGQKIAEGTPTEIQADRSVQEAYLGQRAD
ncbi:MAG: hypothetical protein Ct9H300mP16_10500 [Pseudomonadota bacterium]|nr:MAG: hypothetical protein Ct9H300mP16_10500 [Pseudomonadota bacterium]